MEAFVSTSRISSPSRHQPSLPPLLALLIAFLGVVGTADRVAGQARYELVAAFDSFPWGAAPVAELLQASDGNFYGTTSEGGASNAGTVFRIDADGSLSTLHSFPSGGGNPGRLIQADDGILYGTTPRGGAGGFGTIFKMDPAGTLTTVHSFTRVDGAEPVRLIQATDGDLYGVTQSGGAGGGGTIFKLDAAGMLTTLHSFTERQGGWRPATLIQGRDGNFYGTTNGIYYPTSGPRFNGSTFFKLDAGGTLTTVLYFDWCFDCTVGGLFEALDGSFYETRSSAGISRIAGGGLTTVARVPFGPIGLMQASDGRLYGAASAVGASARGMIFRLEADGTLTTLHDFMSADGTNPSPTLIEGQDGSLYGTTRAGGAGGGTVFKLDLAATLTTLHRFATLGGRFPAARLLEASPGRFYGTTSAGGSHNLGIVFRLDSGALTTLHSFSGADGGSPSAALIQASDGRFYGTTAGGGANDRGTVFQLDPAGTVTTLHSFTGADGSAPVAALIQATDGRFYGTTARGGVDDRGTVFRLEPAGTLTTLHSFTRGDGNSPRAELIQAIDGRFYGTTVNGGAGDRGTVFQLEPDGALTVLHSFMGDDGMWPTTALIQANDGALYGTTDYAASGPGGTLFRLETNGAFTTIHRFTGDDGRYPTSPLIQATDGNLYGTTSAALGGGFGGTVFKLDAARTLTTLDIVTSDGNPLSAADAPGFSLGLIQASDGRLYGTAREAGPFRAGAVFRLTLPARVGTPHAIPGHIQAEDYDVGGQGVGYVDRTPGNEGGAYRSDDVDIKVSREGGYAIGWFSAGEWLAYSIDVQTAGLYSLTARVGSMLPGRTFHLEVEGRDVSGPIAVPVVGDWDTYETVCVPGMHLAAGRQVLRVVMGPEDWMDVQSFDITEAPESATGPFGGTPRAVPGRIEAEDYDLGGQGRGYHDATPGNEGGAYRNDDVDIKVAREGGHAIGWFSAGEWLAYTVDVQTAGLYSLIARVGSMLPGRTFYLEVESRDVSGPIAVPVVADWDTYETVSVPGLHLAAGRQVLRIVMGPDDWMDLDWVDLVR